MKRYLHILKTSAVMLVLVLMASTTHAQKTAVASGSWSTPTTWSPVGTPSATDNVTINSGISVTVTADATCANLIFLSTASANTTVSLNSGITLTVTGDVTIPRATTGVNRVAVGAGILNAGSVSFTSAGGAVRHEITISTGTVTVTGNVIGTGGSGSPSITFSGAGLLRLGGSMFTNAEGTLTPSTGTVEYNAAGAQTIGDFIYNKLTLSGSGAKTTTGATVNGTLSMQGSATAAGTSPTYGGAAILEYNGSAAQTTGNIEFPATLNADLVINNTAGVTLNAAKILNGNLTLSDGVLTAGTNLSMSTTGTPTIIRSEGSITGTLQGTADYNVTYTGNSKTTGIELAVSGTTSQGLTNLTVNLNAGQTLTLDVNRTPDGNLSISAGTFDLSTFTINRSAAGGTLTISDGATLKIGGTNTFPSNYNTHSIGNTSATVEYAGTAQAVAAIAGAETYTNLTLSGSDIKTFAAETVNGLLSIQGTATTTGATPTYGASAILEYKGSAAQTISNVEFGGTGANPTNLRIDNTNGVVLNSAKNINGALTLVNGYLTTTGILTINANGSASTTNGAFVNGPLEKVKNTTAIFTFPVGNLTGGLRTIAVTPTSITATTYKATFISADPRTVTNGSNLGSVPQISSCEYWDLTRTSGTTNARVTLSWPAAANSCGAGSYVGNVATLTVANHNGTNWLDQGQFANTGDPSNGGTVTSNNFVTTSPYSAFALATTNPNQNPLPVMFSAVKAYQKNSGVQIEWSNLTERDLVGYTIERSADGQNFMAIGQQAPRSNLNDKESYTAYDAAPLSGANFYRIRVLEISGKVILSKVLKVDIGGKQSFTLYPNPVSGGLISVGINAKQGQYTVKVLNTAGQQVYSQRLVHQGGSLTQTVELPSSVKPGVYNMVISGDNYREAKMFVVQ
jgi:hypothetical protein